MKDGKVLMSNERYENSNTFYQHANSIEDSCKKFTIYSPFGNGIPFKVTYDGNVVASKVSYRSIISYPFESDPFGDCQGTKVQNAGLSYFMVRKLDHLIPKCGNIILKYVHMTLTCLLSPIVFAKKT